ncbi:MAG: uracil phosphoribosyltransferase [Bacteroidetes bacterium]|nr:uracil phosphoribosyltransferase [Bacteroidota bacterium]
MEIINFSENNSLIVQYLSELRDVEIQKDSLRFRNNISRIGHLMAYEISKSLHYSSKQIQTPYCKTPMQICDEKIVLGTILRAGLPMHQGFLDSFDKAENAFISAYRKRSDDGHVEILTEYISTPSLENKTLILCDPMLATGLSMEHSYKALLKNGTPKNLHIACVIASEQAVEHIKEAFKDIENVTIWLGVIDPELNERSYIIPGLGDAGDLCFGEKL